MILGATAQIFAFALLSLIAILGALGMATTMSMFRSGIFLMASFIGVSGLFILLSADLLGFLQIMMYIGGMLVMVLFMVVLMHDPGGSMMAGLKLAPVETFFSRGLLPKREDDIEATLVEDLEQKARDEGSHYEQHGDHERSSGNGHGNNEDSQQAHKGHENPSDPDHRGMDHDDMDMGDMDMSMVTPVRPYAAWLGLGTGALLVLLLLRRPAWPVVNALPDPGSARQVGHLLMSKYMMAFEGAGLLILVGIFGAVYIARPDRHPSAKGREMHVGQDEMPPRSRGRHARPFRERRMIIPLTAFLIIAAILFGIGVYTVIAQRSAVMILMGVEVLLNAVGLNIVAFWRFVAPSDYSGQIFLIIIVTLGAVEMGIGLAIMMMLYRNRQTAQVDDFAELNG